MLVAAPFAAQALGLGRLMVHSNLDEPLNAEIELISPTAQEIKSLAPSLASRADFDIAGIERPAHLFDIKYSVTKRQDGRHVLSLRTDQAVREPFLHFLIQVDWSGGRLIREYTALLDPPQWVAGAPPAIETAAAAPPAPIPPPVAEAPAPTPPPAPAEVPARIVAEQVTPAAAAPAPVAPAPVAEPQQVAEPRQRVAVQETLLGPPNVEPLTPIVPVKPAEVTPSVTELVAEAAPEAEPAVGVDWASSGEYGPVKRGETLGAIAERLRVDKSVSAQQVMLALQRTNPTAFFGNNVNNLKAGKILKVPSREEVEAVSKVHATREFRAQYDAWQEYKLKLAGASRAVTVADAEDAKAAAPKPDAKHAMKQAPAAKDKGATGAPAKSGKAEPMDLLKIVRANLDDKATPDEQKAPGVETKKPASEERTALTDRVATLEEAIESKEMQNQEMRERVGKMQEQVKNAERLIELENRELAEAQKRAAQEKPAAAAPATTKPTEPPPPADAGKPAAEPKPAEAPAVAAAKPGEMRPQPAAPPVAAKRPAPPPAPQVASGGFLQDFLGDLLNDPFRLALMGGVLVLGGGILGLYYQRRRRATAEFAESILSGGSLNTEGSMSDSGGQAVASDTSFLSDFSQGGMGNIHTDEVDPIAEAEVYLAYGRDEQAEEILKEAIVKDPGRHELKGKLLEIYHQRNDVGAFETLAEELYAALEGKGGKVWDKVEEMGRKMSPSNPMFRGGAPARRVETVVPTGVMPETTAALGGMETSPTETVAADAWRTETQVFDSGQLSGGGLEVDIGQPRDEAASASETSFDLDLDVGGVEEPAEAPAASVSAESAAAEPKFDLDFALPEPSAPASEGSGMIDFNAPGKAEDSGVIDFAAPTRRGEEGLDFSPSGMAEDSGLEFESVPATDTAVAEGAPQSWDETATKLDLAKAYIDMGDAEGARSILDEVLAEGTETQKDQARELVAQIG